MNKRMVRAFATGILFAVSFIATAYYFFQNGKIAISDAKQILEDEGYIVLSQSEFTNLQKQAQRKNALEPNSETVKKTENKNDGSQTKESEVQTAHSSTEKEVISYELKITSGMNTEQIATILANVRIIDDAKDFKEYMSNNGYSTKIQLGTFHLTNEMDYRKIAKILTKR